ncbi:hypothetical protein ND748_28105, partial [Frankia sp. AiPs1]|uniref:hypothetical protein n=1 Tax=Frankia sp. AiPs1 TaxID=573493 RepID=UPI002042EC14
MRVRGRSWSDEPPAGDRERVAPPSAEVDEDGGQRGHRVDRLHATDSHRAGRDDSAAGAASPD